MAEYIPGNTPIEPVVKPSSKPVPKTRQVLKDGQFTEVPESEVDYEFEAPNQMFDNEINLIPFQNAVQSQRSFYTSKFFLQHVAPDKGEVPYVQTLKNPETNESFYGYIGKKLGVVSAGDEDDGAVVSDVTPDYIALKTKDGKEIKKALYNNFAFNRKTFIHNTPVVKAGDKVKSGQVLAKSNYTNDEGVYTPGINARVALTAYKGWSYEDSLVVSEDFAKRMATTQMYKFGQDNDEGEGVDNTLRTGKTHFRALFPDKYGKVQMDNIDDNGVVKPGAVVNPGDPLILSTKARTVTSNDANLGRLGKYMSKMRNDASIVWDHQDPGVVTDVVKSKHGWRVNVKSTTPLKEGDKVTVLSGSKCYHPDTQIFTINGWRKISEITLDDKIASLFKNGAERTMYSDDSRLYAKFETPLALTSYDYDDVLYTAESPDIAYCVTPDHRLLVRRTDRRLSDIEEELERAKKARETVGPALEDDRQQRVDGADGWEVAFAKDIHGQSGIEWPVAAIFNDACANDFMKSSFDDMFENLRIKPVKGDQQQQQQPDANTPTAIFSGAMDGSMNVTTAETSAILSGYAVSFSEDDPSTMLVKRKHTSKLPVTYGTVNYTGKVYCCQSRGLGFILTKYKGRVMWNGNSTISKIVPQNLMPRTMDGKPVDVLFNQLGLPSRINSAMIMSVLLGKVAEKTGKRYVLPSFNKKDDKWYEMVEKELKDAGLTDTEQLYDPEADRVLDAPVTVGVDYFLKLHHMGEGKLSARSFGQYDQNLQPAKGGDEGQHSKRYSGLENVGIISAGAYGVVRDALQLRGQKNDEYWSAVRRGETPSLANSSPFVWDKYIALMRGSGLNAVNRSIGKNRGILQASPFTDRQFEALSPVELTNAEIVDAKDFKPVKGGLFDPALSVANKWGKITLSEPYPNPGFEDNIASILGIRKKDLYDVMDGNKSLGRFGTGNIAIYKALKDVDMDAMLEAAKRQYKDGPKSTTQKALNRIRYLTGLKENELRPEELMITRVPVIPPKFRPYSFVGGDTFIPGDVNELYKDVFLMSKAHDKLKGVLGDDAARYNTSNVYNSIKALYGFGDTMNKKLKQRGVSGFMDKLVGGTSKFSFLNRAVNSKPMDLSAGSVIEMSPELTMDEIDLPNDMAYTLFSPWVQGELVRRGMSVKDAVKAIKNKDETTAGKALDNVMSQRLVYASRAPAWHKYNVLAFKAKRHDGNNILIPNIVSTGLGADNDGDTMNVHVPATEEGQRDARKLLASNQVFSIRDPRNVVNKIKQEFLLGLYNSNRRAPSATHVFKTKAEALAAIKAGKVKLNDLVDIQS